VASPCGRSASSTATLSSTCPGDPDPAPAVEESTVLAKDRLGIPAVLFFILSAFIRSTDPFTEISWAGAELSQRQYPQAKDQLDKAVQKLSATPSQGGHLRFLRS
jgi:hypothetical protein